LNLQKYEAEFGFVPLHGKKWTDYWFMTINVLFVCLGNICRSPMAEAVFSKMVEEAGLDGRVHVDSAGTGSWHIGERACSGTRRVLARNGYQYDGRARQVTAADMNDPDGLIVAMSTENVRDLRNRFGDHPRQYRLLEFAETYDVKDVPDPYYEGNFEYVYELIEDGCHGLLKAIQDNDFH
jgi:protein-tyrosine phosphatase